VKSLIYIYEKNKQELRKKLTSAATEPREVVKILQSKIIDFLDINGEYAGHLNPAQTRIASALLLSLSMSLNSLLTVEQVYFPDLEDSHSSSSNVQLSNIVKLVAPLSGGVVTGSTIFLLSGTFQFVLPLALIAIFGTALGGFVAEKIFMPSEEEQIETDSNANVHLKVDIDKLLIAFEQQLYEIDRDIVMMYENQKPQKEPSKPHLTDLDDILGFFHKFIGDANWEKDQLPEFTRSRLNDAERLLRRYGIQVKFYSEDIQLPEELDVDETFGFEKSVILKIDEPVTQYPAFLNEEGKVLISGLVLTP
jgi:hypothetical protein